MRNKFVEAFKKKAVTNDDSYKCNILYMYVGLVYQDVTLVSPSESSAFSVHSECLQVYLFIDSNH